MRTSICLRLLIMAALWGTAGALNLHAASVQLAWDAPTNNTDGTVLTDLSGYKLHRGAASGNYTVVTDVGNVTTCTVYNLTEGQTYYFAAKSYNSLLIESTLSTEFVWTVPDITAPVMTPPAAQSLAAGTTGTAPMPNLVAGTVVTDNVSTVANIVVTQTPSAGTARGVGITPVTITARDQAGNSAQAIVQVTVVDQTAPAITPPAAQTLPAGSAGTTAIPNLLASTVVSDNVSAAANILLSQSPTAGTVRGLGLTPVTITARDQAGNSAQAIVQITITDQTAPVITAPAPVTVTAGSNDLASVTDFLASLAVSDNCTPKASLSLTQTPAAGALVGVGITSVTIKATDAAGNQSQVAVSLTVLKLNRAPVVSAGADSNIRLNQSATLSGVVSDDGLPAGATVAKTWTMVSVTGGAGTAVFADASSSATTATFTDVGTYVLRLTANDTLLSASDEVTVTVKPLSAPSKPTNLRIKAQ
ncbi:MAG: HYR domain-containing protein [Lentisphaerae bacterium]|nr:HYR domain-containing protein [Lentisphaerota bacterium]